MNIYESDNYKLYLIVPLVLLVAALFLVFVSPKVPQGIDMRGGTTITVTLPPGHQYSVEALEQKLKQEGVKDLSVRVTENPIDGTTGILIEFTGNAELLRAEALVAVQPTEVRSIAAQFVSREETENYTARETLQIAKNSFDSSLKTLLLQELGIDDSNIGIREVGPSLSKIFWDSSIRAILFALGFMALVIFIAFRQIAPSSYVIMAVVFDIIFTLGAMALFQVPLSLPTFAAILMLIGYSVDTDVMLTYRVLKSKAGSVPTRLWDSLKTGLTMTGTTLVVLSVLGTAAFITQIDVLYQIAIVLIFGLVGDIIVTWLGNAVILRWWVERKQ